MSKKKISVLALVAIVLIILGIILREGYLSFNGSLRGPGLPICFLGFLLCCILSSIFGVVGIIVEIIRRNKRGMVICIICILLNFILIGSSRESARRISCASAMKCIVFSLQQYAMDYSGYFPPENGAAGLEYLRKYDYLTDYAVHICPSTKTAHGKDRQPLTEDTVDYVYIGGLTDKSEPNTPMLYDKPGNHQDFGNVGTVDGIVKGFSGKNWMEKIKK